jgi:hypothetical protein
MTVAARIAAVPRSTLYRIMDRHGYAQNHEDDEVARAPEVDEVTAAPTPEPDGGASADGKDPTVPVCG